MPDFAGPNSPKWLGQVIVGVECITLTPFIQPSPTPRAPKPSQHNYTNHDYLFLCCFISQQPPIAARNVDPCSVEHGSALVLWSRLPYRREYTHLIRFIMGESCKVVTTCSIVCVQIVVALMASYQERGWRRRERGRGRGVRERGGGGGCQLTGAITSQAAERQANWSQEESCDQRMKPLRDLLMMELKGHMQTHVLHQTNPRLRAPLYLWL